MSTNVTFPPIGGTTYSVPASGEVGWANLSNYLIALSFAQGTTSQKVAIRYATTTPVTIVSATDCVVVCKLASPGPVSVVLPSGVNGQMFNISDGTGDASTNNITISTTGGATIRGVATYLISANFDAATFVYSSATNAWTVTAQILSFAAGSVARAAIANATPNYVVINNGFGALSEEQYLSQTRGGFGINTSGLTGVIHATAGAFTASTIVDADVAAGANIQMNKIQYGGLNSSTGRISGGVLSINATTSLFDLSAGTGIIVTYTSPTAPIITSVSWSGFTAQTVTNLATADQTYIMINSSGAIVQQTTLPTPSQQRDNIFIGRLSTTSRTSIGFADNNGDNSQSIANQYQDLLDALGPFNVTGNNISTNGANLTFKKNTGMMFSRYYNVTSTPTNPHVVTTTANTPQTFAYRTQLGGTTGTVTNIDPTQYDVGGVITAVPGPAATATVQRVFLFPSNLVRIQYGQNTYANIATATAAIQNESFVAAPTISGLAILIGYIVVAKNCTDLTNTAQANILGAARFDAGSGGGAVASTTMQTSYNISAQPQITLTAALGGIQYRDNAAPIGASLFAVQNNGGGTSYLDVDATGIASSAASTVNRVMVTSGTGRFSTATTTTTEINYISGSTGVTGTGKIVRDTSPALITPDLGTPSAAVLTNATGLPIVAGTTGTLSIARGGTAVTSVTTAPTATAFAGWDANSNMSARNFIQGYASTPTAAGTTTLSVGSNYLQYFTGTSTQTVVMPVTSTLVLGQEFRVVNLSTGVVTVNSSGSNLIQAMAPNTMLRLTCILTSGTTAASWAISYGSNTGSSSGSGIKNYIPSPNDNNTATWFASGGGISVTTESTASNFPDNITQTAAIKILRASGADYVYTRWTMDQADYSFLCGILWAQKYAGTAGDYTLSLYTNTASNYGGTYTQVTLPTTSIPSGTTNFQANGLAGASGTQYMELRINGIAGTTPLYLNAVTFTPNPPGQGPAIGPYASYTPTLNTGVRGTSTESIIYRLVGSEMEIRFNFRQTGAGTAGSGTYQWSMPTGYTIDTAKLLAAGLMQIGNGYAAAGATEYNVVAGAVSATAFAFYFNTAANAYAGWGSGTAPLSTAALVCYATLFIPINEATATLNLGAGAQLEYLSSSFSSFSAVRDPAGTALPTTTPAGTTEQIICGATPWQYVQQTGDYVRVEVQIGGSGPWLQVGQGSDQIAEYVYDGTQYIGLGISWSGTQYIISRGKYRTFGSAAWSGITAGTRYRVVKATASAPVGFGIAGTDGSAGLVNPYTVGSGVVYSANYTPTLTNSTNIAASSSPTGKYTRVGKMVTVSGQFTCSTTAAANTASVIYLSLPIASTFTATTDVCGSGMRDAAGGSATGPVAMYADTGSSRLQCNFNSTVTGNNIVSFTCQYEIK